MGAKLSPYVDYNFYAECYHGSAISDEAFENVELEAEAFVNMVTFGRIERLEEIPIQVKYAVCSVADTVANYSEFRKNNISSESNDGYSITYATQVTNDECQREMLAKARRWLSNTGLMYRGWSKEYDSKC